MASDKECGSCPFYMPVSEEEGDCERHAPRPFIRDVCEEHDPLDTQVVFPTVLCSDSCGEHPLRQRDRLAAMAMQGMLASEIEQGSETFGVRRFAEIARDAYRIADAMLGAAAEEESP
jgi:hypothetical protein